LPNKILILNIIGMFFQYTLVGLLYYFLYKVLQLSYCDYKAYASSTAGLVGVLNHQTAPVQAKLVVVNAGQVLLSQAEFILGDTVSLGRFEGNEIVINDSVVSHEHACITQYKQGFMLSDLQSTNGTYLNNKRLTEETLLEPGDLISIGAVTFRFER